MKLKQKLALFCIKKANKYTARGDFNNIMIGLTWLKVSVCFLDEAERQYLQKEIKSTIAKCKDLP